MDDLFQDLQIPTLLAIYEDLWRQGYEMKNERFRSGEMVLIYECLCDAMGEEIVKRLLDSIGENI